VTAAQIREYLADMGREIRELEDRLRRLRDAAGGDAAHSSTRGGGQIPTLVRRRNAKSSAARTGRATPLTVPKRDSTPSTKRPKRKFTVTPKVLASRALQGRYLPLLNKFSGRRKAAFARTAKDKGREVAIREMEAALAK
jgi:hypothetical protein